MGRVQTSIPDDLEKKLRMEAAKKFEWKKGALQKALIEALNLWLSHKPQTSEVKYSLKALKEKGVIDDSFIHEVLSQKKIFEDNRKELEKKHYGKTIVVCGGDIFVGEDFDDAVHKARMKHGKKPYYSESVGVIDYPSIHLQEKEP